MPALDGLPSRPISRHAEFPITVYSRPVASNMGVQITPFVDQSKLGPCAAATCNGVQTYPQKVAAPINRTQKPRARVARSLPEARRGRGLRVLIAATKASLEAWS